MHFSRAMLGACLFALKWLLWAVALLLVALVAAKAWRGEEMEPGKLLMIAGLNAAGGWLAGRFAGWIERSLR